MSIEVIKLSKYYGNRKVLAGISFLAKPGSVTAFLGPNGAGKSTTFKILSGALNPTTGKAWLAGYSVLEQSLSVRKALGYLPENNPLYRYMYVKEALLFAARLHQYTGNPHARVAEMIDLLGLATEQKKKVQALSKGYQQRLGLACALLHEPKVLLLDEPTTGLDPNQMIEVRQLIVKAAREKTVLLSTHVMQEAQDMCTNVIILNRGKIVADDTLINLQDKNNYGFTFSIGFDQHINSSQFAIMSGVTRIFLLSGPNYMVYANVDISAEIFEFARSQGRVLLRLESKMPSLETIFTSLTMPETIPVFHA